MYRSCSLPWVTGFNFSCFNLLIRIVKLLCCEASRGYESSWTFWVSQNVVKREAPWEPGHISFITGGGLGRVWETSGLLQGPHQRRHRYRDPGRQPGEEQVREEGWELQLISVIDKGTRTLSPTTGGQWESPTGKPGRGRSRTSTSMPLGLSSSISSKTSSQVRWYKYIEKWVNKCRIPGPNPWHRVWLLELRDWARGRGHRDAHWARGGRHGQVRPVLARPRHQEHHSRGLWSHGGGGDQGGRWHHPDKAGGDPSRWGGGSQGQECDPHPGQRLGRSLCARQHLHTSSFYK